MEDQALGSSRVDKMIKLINDITGKQVTQLII